MPEAICADLVSTRIGRFLDHSERSITTAECLGLLCGSIVDTPSGLDGNPNPIVTHARSWLLDQVVAEIVTRNDRQTDGKPLLVAVDGIDGSGKSTFADEIARLLTVRALPVVRASVDSFHNPRAVRWSRGKHSPAGFYFDSHDLVSLSEKLLDPFRTGAGSCYQVEAFDEPSDELVHAEIQELTGSEVLIFDGIFLCRPELVDYWDYSVFLEPQSRVNLTRIGHVTSEAPDGGAALVNHVLMWVDRIDRYSSGMSLYVDLVDPSDQVDRVIDNNDLANPTFL